MRRELLSKQSSEIQGMFGRIAHRYDLLNRTLSLGQDVRWRRAVARKVAAIEHPRVLDVCTGTGDLALTVGGEMVGADFCLPMLEKARLKVLRMQRTLPLCAADALHLPFAEATFDVVTVAFGIRNFADLEVGLGELVRVLRPGGVLLVLEFSRPRGPLAPLLGWWVRTVPPRVGRWLSGDAEAYDYLPVPGVVSTGSYDGLAWMVTDSLPGLDATDASLIRHPKRLVRILARGLRRFHDAPAHRCPFDFRLDVALAHARNRLESGMIDPHRDFHQEYGHLSAQDGVDLLERTRPGSEDLVVCHGDYCLPNVLIENGKASGFLDLGELGVADRWWDLAVASWSATWNLGPGLEDLFFSEYGVERDPGRIEFYRLLYDVVS